MSAKGFDDPLVEWTRSVPPGWRIDRLGNVAEIIVSNVDKHTVDGEQTVRLCNYLDVYRNKRITSAIEFQEASADQREIEKFQILPGDLLITKDSETPDDIAISSLVVDDLPNVICGYHLALVRPLKHKIAGSYLAWIHSSKTFRAQYEAKAVGVTRWGLSQSSFKEARVPLPQMAEQEEISSYLEKSCVAIDEAVGIKQRQIQILDSLRAAIIQRVLTRGMNEPFELVKTGNIWLEEVPRGWRLVALKRLCEIQTGLTLGKEYDGSLVERPYLRVANVQDGHLDLEDVSTIEVPQDVADRVELRRGDVLMTEGGDLDKLGRGYLWGGEIEGCLHQNHIFAVRCFAHKLLPKFLTYLTASRYGRDYFEATGKRTTNLASTNSTKVGLFPVPLPGLKEQERLVDYLEEQLRNLRAIQEIHERQIDTLIGYRESLIYEYVTGQRRLTQADLKPIDLHA